MLQEKIAHIQTLLRQQKIDYLVIGNFGHQIKQEHQANSMTLLLMVVLTVSVFLVAITQELLLVLLVTVLQQSV